jgi:hypothetical protein
VPRARGPCRAGRGALAPRPRFAAASARGSLGAAKRKITRRQSDDGTLIMAWHDLIANLLTLTINEVRLPIVKRETFHILSRPTALQE